jgi:hypothetical protein
MLQAVCATLLATSAISRTALGAESVDPLLSAPSRDVPAATTTRLTKAEQMSDDGAGRRRFTPEAGTPGSWLLRAENRSAYAEASAAR